MWLSSTVEKNPLPPSILTPPETFAKCSCSEAGASARTPPRIVPPPVPSSLPRTKVAPFSRRTPPWTSMLALVPSQVAPAGTTSLWQSPEANVPVQVVAPPFASAVDSPTASAVVVNVPTITINPSLRIVTPFERGHSPLLASVAEPREETLQKTASDREGSDDDCAF